MCRARAQKASVKSWSMCLGVGASLPTSDGATCGGRQSNANRVELPEGRAKQSPSARNACLLHTTKTMSVQPARILITAARHPAGLAPLRR